MVVGVRHVKNYRPQLPRTLGEGFQGGAAVESNTILRKEESLLTGHKSRASGRLKEK